MPMAIKKRQRQNIVTGIGDKGYTYLCSGDKLSKADLRLEVVGTIDELSSFLGVAKSLNKDKKGRDILEKIQEDLFILGNRVSGTGSKNLTRKISSRNIRYLEDRIKELEKKLSFKGFVLPGDNPISSTLHVARTVARRLERRVVALENKQKFKDRNILIYLNRLSDLMFLLACQYSSGKIDS